MKFFSQPYCAISKYTECSMTDYIIDYSVQLMMVFMIIFIFVIVPIAVYYAMRALRE